MELRARRYVLTALACLGATVVVVPAAFVTVLVLAGPHSDILPPFLHAPVVLLCAGAALAVPAGVARAVWRRTGPGR